MRAGGSPTSIGLRSASSGSDASVPPYISPIEDGILAGTNAPPRVRLRRAATYIVPQRVLMQRAVLMARRHTTKADADELPRFFVWVRGLEGPEPQKWT